MAEPEPEPERTGAMSVPGTDLPPRSPLEQIDTTIEIDELRAIKGWPKGLKVQSGGRVLVALHVDRDDMLRLSIVEDNVGTVMQFPITGGHLDGRANDTADGNTFPSRAGVGDYRGPILFAIRTRVQEGGELVDQVAVFSDKASLRVAVRSLSGGDWAPRFKLDFARGTTFAGIGTLYPH